MGLDVEIRIEISEIISDKNLNRIKNIYDEGKTISGVIEEIYEWEKADTVQAFRLYSGVSFYGIGNGSGSWLYIYATLQFLRTAFKEYEPIIFYGDDYTETEIQELTVDEQEKIMEHFCMFGKMKSAKRDYNAPFLEEKE